MCGFGVGLSWATAIIEVDNLVIPELSRYKTVFILLRQIALQRDNSNDGPLIIVGAGGLGSQLVEE